MASMSLVCPRVYLTLTDSKTRPRSIRRRVGEGSYGMWIAVNLICILFERERCDPSPYGGKERRIRFFQIEMRNPDSPKPIVAEPSAHMVTVYPYSAEGQLIFIEVGCGFRDGTTVICQQSVLYCFSLQGDMLMKIVSGNDEVVSGRLPDNQGRG